MLPGPVPRSFHPVDSGWRREMHDEPPNGSDNAWYQNFNNGNQNWNHQSNNNIRGCAVRR